ncbi:MAG: XrtA/PEP-CTERM system TPR-repeat protein PrsT [Bacillota bacterium]
MAVHNARTAISLAATLSLLAAGVAGCTQRQSVNSLLSEAANYEQSGNRNAAIIQLKNALQQDSRNAEARQRLASLYLQSGDGSSAEKEIRRAIDGGMSAEKAWPILAKSLLLQGQFQKVIDEAPPGAQHDPQSLALRGDAYLSQGKSGEASAAYEQALSLRESDPGALVGRARLNAIRRDFAAAHADIDKALTADEKNVDVRLFKSQLLQMEDKPQDALSSYSRVIEIDPSNIEGKLGRAYCEIALEKYEDAQRDLDAIRKLAPGRAVVLHAQAMLDYRQGKPQQALEAVQQVLRAAPEYAPSLLLAGVLQKDLGAYQQAEDNLSRYLDKVPGNLYAIKQLAAVLLRNGDVQRAANVIESGLKSAPDDTQLLALAGDANLREKNFAKASTYFERAARNAPDSARILTAVGVSKLAQGDSAAATEVLEKAVKLDQQSVDAGLLLVNAKIAAKQYDSALATLKKLAADHPDNPAIPNLAGHVYLGMRDTRNARASFDKALALQPKFFAAAASLARLDVQENRHDAARQRFVSLLAKDPSNVLAMLALAELANIQGKPADTLTWLEKANRADPKDDKAAAALATQYMNTGKWDKALTFAKSFALENSESPRALDLLSRVQLANKDLNGALESLERLAKLVPNPAGVNVRIALAHMSKRDFPAAREAVNKALSASPNLLEAQYVDGLLKARQGDADAAQAIARRLQKEQARSAYGHLLEAESWMARKNSAAAATSLEAAFKLEPNSETLSRLHRALELSGRANEADSRASEWLAAHANDRAVRMLVAESNLSRRQYKIAIAHYETLLQSDANNVVALNNLAFAYQEIKDARALDTAEKAYKLAGEDPSVLDTLGWILAQQGQRERGLALLRKSAAMAPNSREIKEHLEQAERGQLSPKGT